ncbi:hypothetical protein [Cupriavidus sp. RAF12]|uniref:hypothetical protein n=1 Tax=Cupriavidus sp. RAF12 TaxID=3233050 RepID=UPI003F8EB324
MFVCQNQSCGAQWAHGEVTIKNEGQGPLFRCPLCGARNRLMASNKSDGSVEYKQPLRDQPGADTERPNGRRP